MDFFRTHGGPLFGRWNGMAMRSFHDILLEKMDTQTSPPPAAPSDLDPAGLAFLLGQVPRFQFKSNSKYKVQASPRREFDSPAKPKAKVRTPGPAHILGAKQAASFEFFAKSDFPLAPDFLPEELKYSFRKLALVRHPDRGGDQQSFVDLKYNYDILRTIFKVTR